MRKLLAAGFLTLPLGIGCSHTGGVCDCAPIPGDSTGHNPHVTYHATCPGTTVPAAPPVVVGPTAPISAAKEPMPAAKSGGTSGSFEPIAPPKTAKKPAK